MDDHREENQYPEQSLQERGEVEGPDELEAARAEREGHAWLEEYLASLPPGPIPSRAVARVSERAIQLIVYFEVTDEATYRRKYQRPVWPGLNSGVTIGIGYDVGYIPTPARLRADWQGQIPDQMISDLERALGVKGPRAGELARELAATVVVPWDPANRVFRAVMVPRFIESTEHALPNTHLLSADSFGALMSLTYNRGPSYSKPGDRFREMRAIKAHMGVRRFESIPGEIRAMKRLWPNTLGLRIRREREAELFEDGLERGLFAEVGTGAVPSPRELNMLFRETLTTLAETSRNEGERRFFFPDGVGAIEFSISVGTIDQPGLSLQLNVRSAEQPPVGSGSERYGRSDAEQVGALLLDPTVKPLLTPHRRHELLGRAVIDESVFLLFDQFDEHAGGQILIEQTPDGYARILAADSVVFPLEEEGIPEELREKLTRAFWFPDNRGGEADEIDARLQPPASDEDLNQRMYQKALECENQLSSRDVPGTNHGRLACAWAVNKISTLALGKPIGGGLATAEMIKVLRRRHTPVSEERALLGNIIISPTAGGVTGHVGIVGARRSGEPLSRTRVYSNSSSRARFEQNFTFGSWHRRYEETLGLDVLFFQLRHQEFAAI